MDINSQETPKQVTTVSYVYSERIHSESILTKRSINIDQKRPKTGS